MIAYRLVKAGMETEEANVVEDLLLKMLKIIPSR